MMTSSNNERLDVLSFVLDVMSIILTQFLTIYDVGKLDTAYCNKTRRSQLLSILSSIQPIDHIHIHKSFRNVDSLFKWIGTRRVTVKILSIDHGRMKFQIGHEIEFKNYNLTDDGLIGLSKHCDRLQRLDISFCYGITDASMIEIARKSKMLENLDISGCGSITDASVIEIGRNCLNLLSFCARECDITDAGLIEISNCTRLQKLNINAECVTDMSMIEISRNCFDLLSLNISDDNCSGFGITDTAMIEVARNCSKLQSLNINWCDNVTDASIAEVGRNSSLISLEFYSDDITDVSMLQVAKNCRSLQSLKIGGHGITDAVLLEVAKNISTNLQSLHVVGFEGENKYTDAGMIEIARRCFNLKSISFSDVANITDATMIEVAKNCSTNLKSLHIGGCEISDVGLIEVGTKCTNLESMSSWGWPNCDISDTSVIQIGRNCPKLQLLEIHNCHDITDTSMIQIGRKCPDLELLILRGCDITDASMIEIGRNCRKLKTLDICDFDGITDMSMNVIGKNCTNLMHVTLRECRNILTIQFASSQLESLDVIDMPQIRTVDISRSFPNLLSLHVRDCNNICMTEMKNCTNLQTLNIIGPVDFDMTEIIENCSNLKRLTMSGSDSITDSTIIEICRKCTKLYSLNIGESDKVTDTSLIEIARSYSIPRSVGFYKCKNISDICITTTRALLPKVHISRSQKKFSYW